MSPRVLVFDDDGRLLALLRTYFLGLGWDVESFADAGEALARTGAEPPFDAVICDLHFTAAHHGEGLDIVSRARARRPQAAVILFTGVPAEGVREEALRRGADEVSMPERSISSTFCSNIVMSGGEAFFFKTRSG